MTDKEKRAKQLFTYCVFGALAACAFAFSTQGFLLTGMIDHYALQSASQGMISASSSVGSIIALTFATLLAGRIKKPLILLFSLIALSVCFFAAGLLPPLALMVVCYAVYGLFFGFIDTTCSSLIADLHPGESGKKYMGLLHGMFGVGSLLAPLLFEGLLSVGLSWHNILSVVGGLFALMASVYLVGYTRCKNVIQTEPAGSAKITFSDITSFLKTRRTLLLLLVIFCYSFHQMGLSLWTKRYISDFLGAETLGAIALSLVWTGTAISRIVMPRFAISPQRLVLFGNLISGVLIIFGAVMQNPLVMCICVTLSGLVQGHSLPMLLSIGCGWYPRQTMLATTLMLWILYVAQMVSPIVIAFVADIFGSLLFGMLTCGVMALVTALMMTVLVKTDKPKAEMEV